MKNRYDVEVEGSQDLSRASVCDQEHYKLLLDLDCAVTIWEEYGGVER